MSRDVEGIERTICDTLVAEVEARAAEDDARALYDHVYDGLSELGYDEGVAEAVAAAARDRLLDECRRSGEGAGGNDESD